MKGNRGHIFRRVVHLLLLAAVGGCVWLMFSHGSTPTEAELADKPHQLTVLTWNTNAMSRYKKPAENDVLKYLAAQDADVVCLQEVDVYKNPRWLTLAEVREIMSRQYKYSYLDFSQYDSRHQFGTMVWSKYPLIHKQSIHYATRGNLSNRCDIVVGTDTLRLFNNHLESYSFKAEDIAEAEQMRNYEGVRSSAQKLEKKWKRARPLRREQARIVRKEIDASPYPVIVVGDFNSTPMSYTYLKLSHGLRDAWAETSWGQWGTTCKKRGLGVHIDYILCSKSLVPADCRIIKEATGSDHRPVAATLVW
ncbi:MAG: endonuclease/exonuclease/phosphatase family protein [Paludibacteraceae bacterium]|nr:endonuclease/exonuclease/phosphatase family protein [Paludibacteraceae bacterium]